MRSKSSDVKSQTKAPDDRMKNDIRRAAFRDSSGKDKIKIVMKSLRDDCIAELRRKEGIAQSLRYTLSVAAPDDGAITFSQTISM